MDIMEGCSKEKSRREGEIIRKGPRRMGPFGPLNSDIQPTSGTLSVNDKGSGTITYTKVANIVFLR